MPERISQNGATIEIPTPEMRAWTDDLRRQEKPIRTRALTLAGEALLSEAQHDAPIKTGFLKESHFLDASKAGDGEVTIGVGASYGLPVHERHASKKRWFIRAIVSNGARVFGKALEIATREAGANG